MSAQDNPQDTIEEVLGDPSSPDETEGDQTPYPDVEGIEPEDEDEESD